LGLLRRASTLRRGRGKFIALVPMSTAAPGLVSVCHLGAMGIRRATEGKPFYES
jgi:hypothetical protein